MTDSDHELLTNKNDKLVVFQDKNIRRVWYEDNWYFSIIDVVAILTDNNYQNARKYWNKLSQRLKKEGNETVTNCHQLKLIASDGKKRYTDITSIEQLLENQTYYEK